MTSRPVVVVLAAGSGSRFAGPSHKLGQRLGDTSVLGRVLRQALASQLPVVVVTTEMFAAEARAHLAARDVVVVPQTGTPSALPLGMGYSIAAGVSARPNASGWLVLPGDMPLVQPRSLVAVGQALEHHPVAFAQYRGRRGHPVGFGAELYSELVALSGDTGARRLLARYPSHAVEVDDPGVLIDIDTEADLQQARAAAP
ncbi:MAG TPA: nucleotidyltransferase family protein [Ideonella sp.]|nr:nucleotidyltransferase family protein [Ideonella sp.]